MRRPWTPRELELVLDAWASGRPYAEIAVAVGRTAKAVERKLSSYRASHPDDRRAKTRSRLRVWRPDELDLVCELRCRGATLEEAGSAVGRSAAAVGARLRRLRLRRLSDPRGRRFAALVGRIISEVRREGIECIPEPFSLRARRTKRSPGVDG